MEVGRMKRIFVEVMTSKESLKRIARTWRSAKGGKAVGPVIGLTSIGELSALLTPKRMELLKYVAEHGPLSVRRLATALERDYKNVHTDVAELEASYLLSRDDDGRITAPYDEIVIKAPLRDAA
jgi:predicted transcriptional regulator